MESQVMTGMVLLLILATWETRASYLISVYVHSLENRGGRCADDQFCNGGEGCCESSTCATTACEYIMEYCQRIPPKALSYNRTIDNQPGCANQRNTKSIVRFERNKTNFAGAEPLRLSANILRYDVVQMYFELRHNYSVLIDRFLLDVPSIPEHQFTPFYLDGIFGYARMNISTSLNCFNDHCGPQCEQTSNCSSTCEPGYTGRFCSNIISSCNNYTCSNSNMRCVNRVLDYDCVCQPGFTGSDCLMDIDECSGGQELCSFHGTCVNSYGSFQCECEEEFTGQFCETKIPRFSVEIKFHSFTNPGGKCADLSGTCANGTGCCDFRDCSDIHCNYMFLYCMRPLGTSISYLRSENRGNCAFNETNSSIIAVGDDFLSNIYGTPNPVKFTTLQSPLNRIEFYIELIDDDSSQPGDENNELVDRFVIPIQSFTSNNIYFGIFELASVNISINVRCSDFYFGVDCQQRKLNLTASITTAMPSVSSGSMTAVPVLVVILSAVIAIFILSAIILIVCYVFRNKKKEGVTINPSFELQTPHSGNNVGANARLLLEQSHHSQSSDLHTIRERLESLPNTYNEVRGNGGRNNNNSHQQDTGFSSPFPDEINLSSNYEEIDSSMRADIVISGSTQRNEAPAKPQVYTFTQKGEDRCDDDCYDYDAPYWNPSNEERGLLSQLEKLKIPSADSSDIKELENVGSGAFGTVVKALWSRIENTQEIVAIKKIEGGVSDEERIIFLKEAVIMGQFNHPNIVKILGIVADSTEDQYQIIMEFMSKGNLRQYLQSVDKSTDVLSSQLLAFSRQIASAMSYLSMKGYVHRDLAARNILICDNSTCKIADFGLSRDMCTESFYLAHGGKIPVKWAAPESINYRLWSTASDVWSYGCVLYEIWSVGYKPFHNCNNAEVLNKLSSGYRLPPPAGCPRAIYQLMINCWNGDSEARPSFCEILSYLNEPEYKITGWSDTDKDKYSEESRKIGGILEDGKLMYEELQNTYKKIK